MAETRRFVFTNFARSTLAARISSSATQLTLQADEGDRFPMPDGTYDEICALILSSGSAYEIAYCTARAGDVLTIERGKEDTTAQAFPAGASVAHNVTKGFLEQAAVPPPVPPPVRSFLGQTDYFTGNASTSSGVPTTTLLSFGIPDGSDNRLLVVMFDVQDLGPGGPNLADIKLTYGGQDMHMEFIADAGSANAAGYGYLRGAELVNLGAGDHDLVWDVSALPDLGPEDALLGAAGLFFDNIGEFNEVQAGLFGGGGSDSLTVDPGLTIIHCLNANDNPEFSANEPVTGSVIDEYVTVALDAFSGYAYRLESEVEQTMQCTATAGLGNAGIAAISFA